jgi:hypothetical protein
MALNDNSADPAPVEKLVSDGIKAAVSQNMQQMVPSLLGDVGTLFRPTMVVKAAPAAPQGSRMKSVRQLRRVQGRVLASRCVIFEAVGNNLSLNKASGFQLIS